MLIPNALIKKHVNGCMIVISASNETNNAKDSIKNLVTLA